MHFIHRTLLFFIFLLCANLSSAQEYVFPINRDANTRIEKYMENDSDYSHTCIRPFTISELRRIIPLDSITTPIVSDKKKFRTWLGRKIFKEHLIEINKDDLRLSIDPVLNLQGGRDITDTSNTYVNTRGILVQASVNDKFYFYTGFHENQAKYIKHVNDFVNSEQVVPGQGRVKMLGNNTYDFNMSMAGVAYTLNRHFDFLLANDKNFFGDGYRSLLLSDNAYNYPFIRINSTFWKFKYTVIYAFMQDLKIAFDQNAGFKKKYARFTYLDLNIGKKNKLSIGIFEAVMWKNDSTRGFDFHYVNPVIFLRPVEGSLGSPDNELLGFSLKYKINHQNIFYGQLMLDEFLLNEVRSGNGWWANKQGFQLGYKSHDVMRVKNLNVQSEFNYVRPFTYQHRSTQQNFAHYNQPLAHPLGANFIESVNFVNYRWKNFFVEAKFLSATIGKDRTGKNDGNNIFYNYDNHGNDYGHKILDGVRTKLMHIELRMDYLINPKTNLNIELGAGNRTYANDFENTNARFIYFGIRTSLENYYFDF